MEDELGGRHVAVTGGTGALGRAVVGVLLDRGASVYVPCIEEAVPQGFPHAGRSGITLATSVELADEGAVEGYYSSLPPLWASVHCAGGFAMSALADTSLAELERLWRMNAVSCFLCCREAVRSIRRGGAGGRIVNVAARAAVEPAGGMVAYTTSKAAVASMTQCMARELADEGILVNAVLPAVMDTPGNRQAMPDADRSRWASPTDVAEVIAFLVSPRNRLASGAVLPVFGRAL